MIVTGSYRRTTVYYYRGYLIYNYDELGCIIVFQGEEIDTSSSPKEAEALIDTWLNAP